MNARRPAGSACTPASRRCSTLPGSSPPCIEGWGGPGAARLLRGRAAADRACATSNSRPAPIAQSPRFPAGTATRRPTGAPIRRGCRSRNSSRCSILLRRLADLRFRRNAGARPRAGALRANRPVPERARRMGGSRTGVRPSICSAMALCCCASATIRRKPAKLLAAAKARDVPIRQVDLADRGDRAPL